MLKSKKGFTLVEIIVCISLLAIIAVIVIVFNVNKDEDKEKKKIISDIVAAADVYGSMNNEIIEKARANYGYYVLTIDELKETGMLDINQILPTITQEQLNSGMNFSYDKIVIDTTDEDNMGFINYRYPYYDNEPEIKNLNDLYIEYEERDKFKCNSLLSGETENDGKIVYLDKEYKKVITLDYMCGISETSLVGATDVVVGEFNLNDEENELIYKTSDNIYGSRKIVVNGPFEAIIDAKNIDDNSEYSCGEWTKSDVSLSLKNIETRNIELSISNGNSEKLENNIFKVTESSNYKVNYSLKGILSTNEFNAGFKECNVKIDKNSPNIDIVINNNLRKITIIDSESEVKGYYISDSDLGNGDTISNDMWKDYSVPIEVSFTDLDDSKYIYAVDNVGNIKKEIIESDTVYPSIIFEPIKDSFSKFKVTIKNINSSSDYNLDLDSIRVQYEFDKSKYKFYNDDYTISSPTTESTLKTFKENFTYNQTLENKSLSEINSMTLPANYINYNNKISGTCTEKECSFTLDMEEFITYCNTRYSYCNKVIDFSDLENMSFDYYIYVKNKIGNYKRVKLNSMLNIFIDENAYILNMYSTTNMRDNFSRIHGINNSQDIVYSNCEKKSSYTYCSLHYHNNKESKNYSIGSYTKDYWNGGLSGAGTGEGSKDVYFTKFTNDIIEYSNCSDSISNGMYSSYGDCGRYYPKNFDISITKYNYNIKNDKLIKVDEIEDGKYLCPDWSGSFSSKKTQEYKTKYSCDSIDISNMSFEYPSLKFNNISNNSFLTSFLGRYEYWYKYRYNSSKSYLYEIDDLLKNSVFTREINEKTYNYILMYYYDRYGYNRYNFYFIPEVSLLTKNVDIGKS